VLHVLEAGYIAEVIDPASGQAVGAGSTGELVLTNLGRVGSPLLRFRTGDLVERAGATDAEHAYSAGFDYRTRKWESQLGYADVGNDFDPQVGFLERPDEYRQVQSALRRHVRTSWLAICSGRTRACRSTPRSAGRIARSIAAG
jgi:hypothetical protein